jgi:hypothetical protein
VAGLAFNLGLLGLFKYAGLFGVGGIFLPLGISFFTFQQVMYLVDTARGGLGAVGLLDYACFIAFFPHLISGPIVRPGHILPQFAALRPWAGLRERLVLGVELFMLGLAKKLVLADGLALRRSGLRGGGAARPAEPDRGLGGAAGLWAADLFRLLRLFGHGDRPRSDVRHRVPGEFQQPVQGGEH